MISLEERDMPNVQLFLLSIILAYFYKKGVAAGTGGVHSERVTYNPYRTCKPINRILSEILKTRLKKNRV